MFESVVDSLGTMTTAEIVRLYEVTKTNLEHIEVELTSRKEAEINIIREEVAKKAEMLGVEIGDIFGDVGRSRPLRKPRQLLAAKYRHPEDPSLTWSGRGVKPVWLKKLIEEGKDPNDFLIDQGNQAVEDGDFE